MNKALIIGLVVLTTVFARFTFAKSPSQPKATLEVNCLRIPVILKELRETYGEEAVFVGTSVSNTSRTIVYINQETGSYTIVTFTKDVGCILDAGDDIRYRLPSALYQKML